MSNRLCEPIDINYGKTYILKNDVVKVKVAPEIGRIIYFGFIGGSNLICLNNQADTTKKEDVETKWINWGGDKVWPAQQSDWPFIYQYGDWPPQTELDGMPFAIIESSATKLVMESAVDKKLHVRLRRTLILDSDKPKLTIKNRLIRDDTSAWPVQIWSITQCILPKYSLLGIYDNAPDKADRPFLNLWDTPLPDINAKLYNNALRLLLTPETSIAKAGTIGSWCAGVYNDIIFLQQSDSPLYGCYPDGANIEVFADNNYIELEILSPSKHLQKGESMESLTIWSLIKTKSDVSIEDNLKLIENNNREWIL